MARAAILNAPSLISLSRLLMAAAFVFVANAVVRLALIAAAALTDFLDGWLARRNNQVTRMGALIDPLADRAFVLVAISTFLFSGAITTWQYFILLARDLATAAGFLLARSITWLRDFPFQARFAGKVVTTLQLITLAVLVVAPQLAAALIIAVGVLSAWAIADYSVMLWRARE